MPLLQEAVTWYVAGYMPLPVKPDGSKAPAVARWREFQNERPPLNEVLDLFAIDSDGIGLLCGACSGGLEMLELEGRAVDEGYTVKLDDAFRAHDMGDLADRIRGGYIENTPSGGLHFYYRVEGHSKGNTKLARRPATPDELTINPGEKLKVLIETRAQGGFTVIAPSAGRTHGTGQSWWAVYGSLETIPTITEDERDAIHVIASTLDQVPVQEPPAPSRDSSGDHSEGLRPGDDFNIRGSWDEILKGWKRHKHYGGNTYGWRKPGKKHPGISATTGRDAVDRLYVFSTSTPFEPETPYTKFGAFALLEFGGDYSAAARELRQQGFGEQSAAKRNGRVSRSETEQLAHLLESVLKQDPMVYKEHLHWVAGEIYRHHPPRAINALRTVALRAGIDPADVASAIDRAKKASQA